MRAWECDVCHHAAPSDAKDAYVSCGASEECHSLKGTRERDPQSLFWAYHTKNSEPFLLWLPYGHAGTGLPVRATCLPRAAEPKESKSQSVCCPAGRDPAGQFFLEPGRLPGAGMRA